MLALKSNQTLSANGWYSIIVLWDIKPESVICAKDTKPEEFADGLNVKDMLKECVTWEWVQVSISTFLKLTSLSFEARLLFNIIYYLGDRNSGTY